MLHLSVVTASYNSADTILKTIQSVQEATGNWGIQQVFVDGGSKDDTLSIIRQHMKEKDVLISEPDDGISDAFNKGVMAAEGNYIHILNSDDWAEPDFWDVLLKASEDLTIPMLHSDLNLISKNKFFKAATGSNDYTNFIDLGLRGIMHPSTITHSSVFEKIGMFSKEYKYAMDLEWFQRAYDHGIISKYVPGAYVNFVAGEGQSFRDYGVIKESTKLARARGVSEFEIRKMQFNKRLRLVLHKYYAALKTLGK